MSNRQTIIEIHGKRYDAITGHKMTAHSSITEQTARATPPKVAKSIKNMDGFIKKRNPKTSANSVHSAPQKPKTLMRSVVQKPKLTTKPQTNLVTPKVANHPPLNTRRQNRANKIQKSRLVSRFGMPVFQDFKIKPKHTHIAVQKPPAAQATSEVKQNLGHTTLLNSIQTATSHAQPKLKKPTLHHRTAQKLHITPKTLNIGSIVLASVLLFGFIAYQNIPNIAVRVAAARAGVSANMPSYLPAGFSLFGHIVYKPGQITISYKSSSDDRVFRVTQSTSAWDSEALLQNYVATSKQAYQTYQDRGKTIYIYEGSNATWVDNGIWYQVEGTSSLNSDQLIHLANSL